MSTTEKVTPYPRSLLPRPPAPASTGPLLRTNTDQHGPTRRLPTDPTPHAPEDHRPTTTKCRRTNRLAPRPDGTSGNFER